MNLEIDSENIITKHPEEVLFWGMPFPLQEGETISGEVDITLHPDSNDDAEYDLTLTDQVVSGEASETVITVKATGGKLFQHYIAEFKAETIKNAVARTRVIRGRIHIN